MANRTVLITGATDGLGKALARHAAAAGGTLLLHGRSEERIGPVAAEIREETGNDRIRTYPADLARLDEVRRLAAYTQSKLAQILFMLDLAEELQGSGVTTTALHPSTYMPTKMVTSDPLSTLEQGVEAVWRLVDDPALDGVSGVYFDVLDEARADPQAYDADARRRLRELSERLVGTSSG